jgi:hypothetical protein
LSLITANKTTQGHVLLAGARDELALRLLFERFLRKQRLVNDAEKMAITRTMMFNDLAGATKNALPAKRAVANVCYTVWPKNAALCFAKLHVPH